MTMDYTRDPPMFVFNKFVKEGYFDAITPRRVAGSKVDEYEIEIKKVRDAMSNLMHMFDINFIVPDGPDIDLTDEQTRLLYPFAYVLACLDGNAFTGQVDTVTSYTKLVYRVIASNCSGATSDQIFDELREMVSKAKGGD